MAHLYDPGVLHSPRREHSTKLLRIEGTNMDRVKRLPYEAVTRRASVPPRSSRVRTRSRSVVAANTTNASG